MTRTKKTRLKRERMRLVSTKQAWKQFKKRSLNNQLIHQSMLLSKNRRRMSLWKTKRIRHRRCQQSRRVKKRVKAISNQVQMGTLLKTFLPKMLLKKLNWMS
uniref:(northern house mosquito) hypothetical protein n=1 Tax=Culex pipiens TaxID=7175 RepID=A0A8D8ET06_CULPI